MEVEVDRETGLVTVQRIAAAHDVGLALNPMGVEGQIQGGAAMAIGYALTEEMVVNDEGKLINPSFVDYKLPLVPDMPEITPIIVETIDPNGPFGAKGVGETGVIPPGAAIANAVNDAVGVRIKKLPMTAEKVFWALQEKEREA